MHSTRRVFFEKTPKIEFQISLIRASPFTLLNIIFFTDIITDTSPYSPHHTPLIQFLLPTILPQIQVFADITIYLIHRFILQVFYTITAAQYMYKFSIFLTFQLSKIHKLRLTLLHFLCMEVM